MSIDRIEERAALVEAVSLRGLRSYLAAKPELRAEARKALQSMPELLPRELEVLTARLGLEGTALDQIELAERLSVTRTRVGQIEQRALRKLRTRTWASGWRLTGKD